MGEWRFVHRLAILLLLVASLVASGCGGPPVSTSSSSTRPAQPAGSLQEETFDAIAPGALPAGWAPDVGTWSVVANATAPSPGQVLQGAGAKGRNSLLAPGAYLDFEATVTFVMVAGEHPQGAGLSFRYAPDGSYRVIRYSTSEQGWHYFIARGADAEKVHAGSVGQNESHPVFHEWVTLRVRAEGRHVQAWHVQDAADGGAPREVLVIDLTEAEEPKEGQVGPFVRGDTVALFDDFGVDPICRIRGGGCGGNPE